MLVALALALGLGSYGLGAYSHAVTLWPMGQLRNLKRAAAHQTPSVIKLDPFGRLLAFPGKAETPCPPQTSRTAVIVIFGGSNGGNYTASASLRLQTATPSISVGASARWPGRRYWAQTTPWANTGRWSRMD